MHNTLDKRNNRCLFMLLPLWLFLVGLNVMAQKPLQQKQTESGRLSELKQTFKDTLISLPYDVIAASRFLGSAATVHTKQVESMLSSTLLPSLQGRLPGLYVSQIRGARLHQTSASSSGTIFSFNTPTMGKEAYSDNTEFNVLGRHHVPVVVVDGVQRELYSLDAEAIESISYQKDALSSMFLGMRSSRGALVITTKNPVEQGFQLSFTGRFGVQSAARDLKPLSAYQYAYLLNEALLNDGKNAMYSYADFKNYRTGESPFTHPNINWKDEVMKNNSTIQSYNLNATGGNRFAQYFISIGYMGENGLFRNPGIDVHNTNLTFNRYMISSKVNINITRDLTAKVTLMGRVEEGTQPGGNGNGYSDILNAIYTTPNNAYPVKNPDGSWGGNQSFTNNLLAQTINSGYITDGARDVLGSINLKYDFGRLVKGLSARIVGSVTSQNRSATKRTMQSEVFAYHVDNSGKEFYTRYGEQKTQSNVFSAVSAYQQMYGQLSVNYDGRFGVHGLKVGLTGDTRNILTNWDLPEYPSNMIADVAYDYAHKYFLQAAISESFYNRYAPGRRWGTFYALGVGWDMSKEVWLQDLPWINRLKLRAVFGKTGNGLNNAGYYTYYQTYSAGGDDYKLGTNLNAGSGSFSENSPLANPYQTWEKAHKLNVGLDMSLFNNTLKVTADYFNDYCFDLLQMRGKSIELIGQTYPNENIGKARWYGGELAVTYQNNIGDLSYYVSANWSSEQSKLIYKDEQSVPYDYLRETGNPVGSIRGLVAEGFFQSREEIAASAVIEGYENIQPGDIKYKDQNGDGVINEFDKRIIGGTKPLSYFGIDLGLAWRGFEFSMLWQGTYNRDMLLGDWTLLQGFQAQGQVYGQAYENLLARWTPETAQTAVFPRLSAGGNAYNQGGGYGSSFWLRSGNYIRLKNISIGYSLPESFCRNYLGGTHVKLFVNGQNLLTKAACNLVDPEVSFTNYPLQRCISTGINVKF